MGDYTAAYQAGVPFIFASYGFGKVPDGMVATVDSFSELTERL
jgi:phosphoglycolate phosphatase